MSRIIRLLSSDIVIPFREWGPKKSSHNGRKSQGITPESFDVGPPPVRTTHPARSPHPAAKPLRPTFRGPKHHEPARPPCPQSSGTCRQGLAGSRGPRARREQPVVSFARSGAEAQTGQRDIDPARVAESCSQRRHRGRCADAPSWCTGLGKVRLGCDVGEGVGRSQSVIVVRDDLGVLEIFANQFESKAETAHAICGLAQKWQIGLEGIIFDGNGNTGRDILRALERLYPYGLVPFFGSRPGGRWYTNLRTACAAALARRLDPDPARGLTTRKPFAFPNGPHIPALFKELGELRYKLKGQKSELEPKEDMMIRLGRSPDFCDALTMTFRDEAFQGL